MKTKGSSDKIVKAFSKYLSELVKTVKANDLYVTDGIDTKKYLRLGV
jgi:hypothetical protein